MVGSAIRAGSMVVSTLGAFGAVGVSIIHCAAAGDTHCA